MNGPNTEIRRTVLRRDGWKCAICNREIDSHWSGYSIHHRRLRSQGSDYSGLHQPENLLPLCGSGTTGCHGWVHAHPSRAYQLGYLVHMGKNPATQPVYYQRHGWQRLTQQGERLPSDPPEGQESYIPDIRKGNHE